MDFDDDDFEDLFDEENLLQGSSQESLNEGTANISVADVGDNNARQWEHFKDADDPKPNIVEQTPAGDDSTHANQEPRDEHVALNVLSKIEDCFEHIVDALLNEKDEVSITLKSRKPTSSAADHTSTCRERRICFPGKTAEEAWRFSVVLRIVELMHEALCNDVVLSKRDIFYRDPALFGKQTHVDRYVDDIAFTFGTIRSALNITAAAKGLIAGAFNICRRDGFTIDASADREGILVPSVKEIMSVDMANVQFILVIEKEATFRSIAASDFWEVIRAQGVIMTGKGYPDLASRAMLRLLSSASPQNRFAAPPVYGLADFDPDGMAILSTYQHGSKALAHEADGHCVPHLERLGLHSKHLFAGDDAHSAHGILALTPRDRRKAIKQLCDYSDDCRTELQTMLMLNMKAELQLLEEMHDLLTIELGCL